MTKPISLVTNYMTMQEACDYLNITRQTMHRWISKDGNWQKIARKTPGGKLRFKPDEIDQVLRDQAA